MTTSESDVASTMAAWLLDGRGGGRVLTREALRLWTGQDGPLWVHLSPASIDADLWLANESGLAPGDRATLLRPVNRTRLDVGPSGELYLALRIVPPGVGEDRAMRVVATATRLVSVSSEPPAAMQRCAELLAAGKGPATIADLVFTALQAAAESDEAAALDLDREVAEFEYARETAAEEAGTVPPEYKTRAARLRRRIASEREGAALVLQQGPAWLVERDRDRWRQVLSAAGDRLATLDDILDRLRALQDAEDAKQAAVLNQRLYVLTVISGIMLPLSFLTGLLGVNLGGIPLRETGWAFAAFCLFLIVIAAAEYAFFVRLRWFPPPGSAHAAPSRGRPATRRRSGASRDG